MLIWILGFVVTAVILIVVSKIVSGFEVDGFGPAIIAAIVLGIVNGTLGFVLRILTFPINFLTLGLFSFVISALMLLLVSKIVPGFKINGFWPALLGALLIALGKALVSYLILRDAR
jgi:putative membrane protein